MEKFTQSFMFDDDDDDKNSLVLKQTNKQSNSYDIA